MWTLGETSSLFYLFQFAAAVSGRGILLLSLGFSMRFASQQFLFHKHLKHLELWLTQAHLGAAVAWEGHDCSESIGVLLRGARPSAANENLL